MKNILRLITDLFCTPKCVCCGKLLNDSCMFLCDDCAVLWLSVKAEICPSCKKTCDVCECLPPLMKNQVRDETYPIWCAFYDTSNRESVSSKLVFKLKSREDSRLVRFIALEMAAKITTAIRNASIDVLDVVITYAPRSRASISKHGFDHARKLAKEVAKITKTEFQPLIKRVSGEVQKSLTYDERIENAAQSYEINAKMTAQVTKKHAFLIDDVITTGSTLAACQSLLWIPSTAVTFLKTKPKSRKNF